MDVDTRARPDLRSREDENRGAELSERYPARAAAVPAARKAVTEFAAAAGARQPQLDAMALAVSEAVGNAVLYAYPDREGTIHVSAWAAEGELWLLVGDDGVGLRAGAQSAGLGLGLGLVSALSDGLSVHDRARGGTELRMRFDLEAGGDQVRGSVSSATLPASPVFSTTR
jgi:anti-sigma regulatory factor (Ser/Thr protein kinase)